MLLAAAQMTGLIPALTAAVPRTHPWVQRLLARTLRMLLLTLLFLCAVGLRRPWDVRTYTGDALGLLTGRVWAYSYRMVERFLALIAHTHGDVPLTDALARWTTALWQPLPPPAAVPVPTDADDDLTRDLADIPDPPRLTVSLDNHRKPVYSDYLLPRGLVGRLGQVLPCRTVVLLHDADGHVLLATTHRGDQHLTVGVPQILERYAAAIGQRVRVQAIVDREGMSTAFLFQMALAGHTVVTILRQAQDRDRDSFVDVGPWTPLVVDADGTVVREVALARYHLTVPDHPETFPLTVALIRDHRWRVPLPTATEVAWDADLEGDAACWWADEWVAPPAPPVPTQPKLIPIVSTTPMTDALALVQLYTARWPQQENRIKDFLLPLGLDTNHGFARTEVEHSEVAKQRTQMETTLVRIQDLVQRTRQRIAQTVGRIGRIQDRQRLRQQRTETADAPPASAAAQKDEQALARAQATVQTAHAKLEAYCQEARQVRRSLDDLEATARQMYEVDQRKDQVMTVFKVALVNLILWVRAHWFPASSAHATWRRLEPFFRLPGLVVWEREVVRVFLRPFNDRAYNRDLRAWCQRVTAAEPRLPCGRRLVLIFGPPRDRQSESQRRC